MKAALVLLSLVFLYGMSGCEGDTSVGVGAGGLAVIDTKDGIVQVQPAVCSGTACDVKEPVSCPLRDEETGAITCSCDSFFAGEC